MKNRLPLILTLLFALWPLGSLRGPKNPDSGLPVKEFGALPVVSKGRHQPFDSLARNTLMQLRLKQTMLLEPWNSSFWKPSASKKISATEWLMELMMKPEVGDTRPCFRVDNDDLKFLLGLPKEPDPAKQSDGKHYSWNQMAPKYDAFIHEAQRAAAIKEELRSAYERSVMDLSQSISTYQSVKATLSLFTGPNLEESIAGYRAKFVEVQQALSARTNGQAGDPAILEWAQTQLSAPLIVPPHRPEMEKDYQNVLNEIRLSAPSEQPHFALASYTAIVSAYRAGDMPAMTKAIADYRSQLEKAGADEEEKSIYSKDLKKGTREQLFNFVEPFYKGMQICAVALLLALAVWFAPEKLEYLRKSSMGLMTVAWLLMTVALIMRMVLEGRPPVTNLYSSAVFIGWAATAAGLIIEKIWPVCIGVVVSAFIGFATLIIAHFLSLSGDTMVMLQAVLDTNFWLATHVVVVTLGYMATYVAGVIGIIYVVRSLIDPSSQAKLGGIFSSMVFGVVCFGVLFSFVGTVLGGIWADQSWGRFWGWDPKENGALIIVLWNALILHARLGGLVRERGLMLLAIVGNVVTSWSWFGTNMLGIGLHSYGFIDAAFYGLWGFIAFNCLIVLLGRLLLPASGAAALKAKKSLDAAGSVKASVSSPA
ncbi:MAG: cytochrome C biogenesis protein [Verrucomicrobiaceae bacterium]|nr:MAG: cytochrome C biogenesis protein [Verrucomicrobiaceae bacterium]